MADFVSALISASQPAENAFVFEISDKNLVLSSEEVACISNTLGLTPGDIYVDANGTACASNVDAIARIIDHVPCQCFDSLPWWQEAIRAVIAKGQVPSKCEEFQELLELYRPFLPEEPDPPESGPERFLGNPSCMSTASLDPLQFSAMVFGRHYL